MRENVIELSKKEWELMKICWNKKKLTVNEILDEMPKERKRTYQTIKTQLDRLVEKGYLERERKGPLWLYNTKIM